MGFWTGEREGRLWLLGAEEKECWGATDEKGCQKSELCGVAKLKIFLAIVGAVHSFSRAADRVLLKVSRNFQSYGELRTGEEINTNKGELTLGLLSSFWKKQLGCQKAGLRVCITIAPFWFDCKLSVGHSRSNEFRCICIAKQGSAVGTYHPELSYREASKTRAANDTWMQNVCFPSSYRVQ